VLEERLDDLLRLPEGGARRSPRINTVEADGRQVSDQSSKTCPQMALPALLIVENG
jgi:hypothetical protein